MKPFTAFPLLAGLALPAAALPQESPVATPSPPGDNCTWYEDHWDCESACSTVTITQLGIDATVTDFDGFMTSMDSAHSTSGVTFSGEEVFIFTSVYTYPGGSFTGYGVYDSHALTQAGYTVITELHTTTTCETSYTLPPSPTGSVCSPHADHWHCDPTPGPEPTSPPGDEECVAHDDHWHCPDGVEEPPYLPGDGPDDDDDDDDDDNNQPSGGTGVSEGPPQPSAEVVDDENGVAGLEVMTKTLFTISLVLPIIFGLLA
ncbi:hypothetical protein ACRALDRAFT_1059943 [Sodiomyces alcalophilus JCM 7366]|uniref:uncharacterized protein n=1 Tax=Sodiomyces alcalophilus JCM 7366 TaxID=591952 RepID=UPI0039B6B8F9